jgi:hypothetical protein
VKTQGSFRVHKNSPLEILLHCFFKIHCSKILHQGLPSQPFRSRITTTIMYASVLFSIRTIFPTHIILMTGVFGHSLQIQQKRLSLTTFLWTEWLDDWEECGEACWRGKRNISREIWRGLIYGTSFRGLSITSEIKCVWKFQKCELCQWFFQQTDC